MNYDEHNKLIDKLNRVEQDLRTELRYHGYDEIISEAADVISAATDALEFYRMNWRGE